MSIDLSGLSAKQLGALIKNAKKQQTVVAKRTRSQRSAPS